VEIGIVDIKEIDAFQITVENRNEKYAKEYGVTYFCISMFKHKFAAINLVIKFGIK
jgi:hypothetical protein